MKPILTFVLPRTGVTVLAKALDRPYTFANRVQAEKHVRRLRAMGYNANTFHPPFSRPFFVRIDAPVVTPIDARHAVRLTVEVLVDLTKLPQTDNASLLVATVVTDALASPVPEVRACATERLRDMLIVQEQDAHYRAPVSVNNRITGAWRESQR